LGVKISKNSGSLSRFYNIYLFYQDYL